jgi:hypothetical protein
MGGGECGVPCDGLVKGLDYGVPRRFITRVRHQLRAAQLGIEYLGIYGDELLDLAESVCCLSGASTS